MSIQVSIGGRPLCNLQCADNIDLLGDSEEELHQLTERLEKAAAGNGVEIKFADQAAFGSCPSLGGAAKIKKKHEWRGDQCRRDESWLIEKWWA